MSTPESRYLRTGNTMAGDESQPDGVDEWQIDRVKNTIIAIDHDIETAAEYSGLYLADLCLTMEPLVFANLHAQPREKLIEMVQAFRSAYLKQIDGFLTDQAETMLEGLK